MATKELHELVEESKKDESPQLLPFPEAFAKILGNMSKSQGSLSTSHSARPKAFRTTSGLQFVFTDSDP
jgi:hypothetical protein